MGNPNAGKSALFSRLTGTHVVASNYAGTTVEFTKGNFKLGDKTVELIDVPGAYTLDPTNKAEEVAVKMVSEGDLIINVIDSTNLERNLYLTLQLLQTGKPMIIALNMWDEAQEHGVEIDAATLAEELGVPVETTCAISGEGVKSLIAQVEKASVGKLQVDTDNMWRTIGEIIEKTQTVRHRHPTIGEKLSHATVHPVFGPFFAAAVLFISFGFVAYLGDWFSEEVMERIFNLIWLPIADIISSQMGRSGFIHEILIGRLINGEIDFEQSFGLITTGFFIPIAVVLPFIFCFYFILSLLEDIGYLPRLGILMDTLMHRIGLHGLSIMPMMLGLGCNVPGAMAGRILETRKERFIAMTLLAICVPCMAQLAMVVGLLGQAGIIGLAVVFMTLIILWLALGVVMRIFLKGETPEILVEIPPYRLPYWKSIIKKVYMRMTGFLKEAFPYVMLGVFIVNLLYFLGIITVLSNLIGPVITTVFGLPGEAVGALMIGFLRKDVAVGMLAPLGLELKQLIVASTVLIIYFPCVATFVVLFKELGIRDLIKSTGIMLVTTLIVGGGLNLLLTLAGV